MSRLAAGILLVALLGAGGLAVWQATHDGCGADHLPDKIGIYHRTSQELETLDPMPVASGVRMGPPELVLELPADGTCPVMDPGGPMGIWLKVNADRYVLYARPGGP